ncbi:MAG: divergent polysaccharide deacetylase family protein [Wenzhouxiangella sp.]
MSRIRSRLVQGLLGGCLLIAHAAADGAGRIAIIIDDLGYQQALDRAVMALDTRIAVAVIPDGPAALPAAEEALTQGREILIHLPLTHYSGACEAIHCPRREWSPERMRQHLAWAARQVPGAVGLSNHQGSKFTADTAASRRLIEGLVLLNNERQHPLFVVDSRTTALSQLAHEAARAGIGQAQRRVFLDHERNPEAIEMAWRRLLQHARSDGYALAIGHPYPETIAFLAQAIPSLSDGEPTLVPVSVLVEQVDRARPSTGLLGAGGAYPSAPGLGGQSRPPTSGTDPDQG